MTNIDGQVVFDGELHGFFRGAFEVIDGPIFDEAADGAGAEECRGFDGDADALRNFGDGADVGFDGARGAVGADFHPIGGDFAGEGFGVLDGARAGAGKADVERLDAERFHQVEDFDFFVDGGIVDGGILQAVAEGFVVEEDARAGRDRERRYRVPVVDVFGVVGCTACDRSLS